MGEDAASISESTGPRRPAGTYRTARRIALLICLTVVLAYAGNSWMRTRESGMEQTASDQTVVRAMGIVDPSPKHLSSNFTDSRGLLLADPPTDPAKLQDPQTIVLAHLDLDPDTQSVDWSAVEKHLAKVTGIKVVDQVFDNSAAQLQEISDGKITVVALHAADAPFLVNNYGFQPIAVMGNEGGAAGNKMDLIVPSNSPLAHAANVQGHSLTCSVPSSITGYRAAVALLVENQQLRPNVDYFINWSLKMKDSIKGIIGNKYEIAAISDDKLHSMLQKGSVKESQYHVIYQSDVIPRTTVGTFYNLKPELTEKIRGAILSFQPTEVVDPDPEASDKPMHFLPVDYKKDFALVREIDDRFDPRLDTKTKSKKAATSTTAP